MNYTPTYLKDLSLVQQEIPNLSDIMGSRVLITGATGLIGSAIVDFLLNLNDTTESHVTVFIAARDIEKANKRFDLVMNRSDVVFVEYDAMQNLAWNYEVDYIIHAASPANPLLYAKQPVETMLANILGLNNILDYAKNNSVKRVLFVSSSEVYGRKDNNEPYSDNEYGYVDVLNPRACYPSAKRACETLCASYLQEYAVDSVIARLGHIFGPTTTRQDTRASSAFFFDILDGHDIVMKSPGLQVRSYVYVPDCVSAIITVLLNGKSGKAYNVSNPNSVVSIRTLAEQIAKSSARKVVFENPSDEERKGYNLMDNSSLDSTELQELGWNGMFSLSEGVEHTISIMSGVLD